MENELKERRDNLNRLLDSYHRYRSLLDEFKFEKMRYVRAYDKFTLAVQEYENTDSTDAAALAQAQAEYDKWKDMAAKDYDNCMELKIKGDAALRELQALKKLFLPEASTEGFEDAVLKALADVEAQLEDQL